MRQVSYFFSRKDFDKAKTKDFGQIREIESFFERIGYGKDPFFFTRNKREKSGIPGFRVRKNSRVQSRKLRLLWDSFQSCFEKKENMNP